MWTQKYMLMGTDLNSKIIFTFNYEYGRIGGALLNLRIFDISERIQTHVNKYRSREKVVL